MIPLFSSAKRVLIALLLILAAVIWFGWPNYVAGKFPLPVGEEPAVNHTDVWARRGQWGDQFGALSAFFTAFAAVGALFAIEMQRQELRKQREQLDEQNKLAKAQFQLLEDERKEARQQAHVASLPAFALEAHRVDSSVPLYVVVRATNGGAPIRNIVLHTPADVTPQFGKIAFWRTYEFYDLTFEAVYNPGFSARICFEFTTTRGEKLFFDWTLRFEVPQVPPLPGTFVQEIPFGLVSRHDLPTAPPGLLLREDLPPSPPPSGRYG